MDGSASYLMEYPGPVALPAAAVVAFGDYILVRAQDAQLPASADLTRVDHEFTNIGPVRMSSQVTQSTLHSLAQFCAGDGVDPNVTTPCPCGNSGAVGHGCASSVNANGGWLRGVGVVAEDAVVLLGSDMPATSNCIYLQGDGVSDTVFGDGVRCAGGSLIRLRIKVNVGGASRFPDSTDTITLSQRGGVTPGSGAVRRYQTYYRNAAAAFCPPETFNVTNGVIVTW